MVRAFITISLILKWENYKKILFLYYFVEVNLCFIELNLSRKDRLESHNQKHKTLIDIHRHKWVKMFTLPPKVVLK